MQSLFSADKHKEMAQGLLLKVNLGLIILTTIILLYVCSQRIFITESDLISNEASKRDFCALTMKQMIQKKLSTKLMQQALFDLVTRDNYSTLFLKGKEKITGLWSGEESCKILIKGEVLRSFDFYLTASGEFPFYYQVKKITENELFEKEME